MSAVRGSAIHHVPAPINPIETLTRKAKLPTMIRRYRMLASVQANRWNNLEE